MKPIVIFGTGDLAACVHFYLTNDSEYKIVAFTADRACINSNTYRGLPLIPFDEVAIKYPPEQFEMFIAIGYRGLNSIRTNKFLEAKEKGYKLISYISSKSTVWKDLQIGENCFVAENNVIQPFVTLEDNIFIWSANLISHHSYISKNCFITSHVVISGRVKVEENCFFGVNSTVKQYVKIEKNSIVGANSLILNDTPEDGAYITEATELSRVSSRMLQYSLGAKKK